LEFIPNPKEDPFQTLDGLVGHRNRTPLPKIYGLGSFLNVSHVPIGGILRDQEPIGGISSGLPDFRKPKGFWSVKRIAIFRKLSGGLKLRTT